MGFPLAQAAARRAVQFYNGNPLISNSVSGIGLFFTGDLLAQKLDPDQKGDGRFDLTRAAKMGALGILLNGAGLHTWYKFVERVFPGKSSTSIVNKILLEQLLWAPPVLTTTLAYVSLVAKNETAGHAAGNVSDKFSTAYVADWKVWPATNVITYYLIPINFRPLFVGGVQCFFQAYMSLLGHESEK